MEKMKSKVDSPKKNTRRGRPRKTENWTPETLRERAYAYFERCDDRIVQIVDKEGNVVSVPKPMPYSIEGLCVYLDIHRSQFDRWRKGGGQMGERAELIHQKIMADRIEGALESRQHANFAMFMLKNNSPEYYREKVEVENTVAEHVAEILERSLATWVPGGKADHES